MTERDFIIRNFSDFELLKFYQIGGRVPVEMFPRLERLVYGWGVERFTRAAKAEMVPPEPVIVTAEVKPSKKRKKQLRYAIENLVGKATEAAA